MSTKQIDLLNIGLMVFSCVLAFLLPFELFLFSYAVLGPLHYLTEISWLHKRDYFANSKKDYWWLVVLSLGVFAFNFIFKGNPESNSSQLAAQFMIFLAFAMSLAFVLYKDFLPKLIFTAVAVLAGLILNKTETFFLLFSIFLPTLIHVFCFTGLFIIYGALKSKSITGLFSIVVFVGCGISFFLYHPVIAWYHPTPYAVESMNNAGMWQMNVFFMKTFQNVQLTAENFQQVLYQSEIGKAIMRFIAFAYTYHYLNWFSKTSVIKWHEVPKPWLISVILLWLLSVGIYAYDYKTGLVALYLLSMMHVLMEFPLNYRSVIGIGTEIKNFLSTPTAATKK